MRGEGEFPRTCTDPLKHFILTLEVYCLDFKKLCIFLPSKTLDFLGWCAKCNCLEREKMEPGSLWGIWTQGVLMSSVVLCEHTLYRGLGLHRARYFMGPWGAGTTSLQVPWAHQHAGYGLGSSRYHLTQCQQDLVATVSLFSGCWCVDSPVPKGWVFPSREEPLYWHHLLPSLVLCIVAEQTGVNSLPTRGSFY